MSMIGCETWTPYRDEVRASCATFATFSKALLGTQPVHVQSPPIRSLSSSTTRAPRRTAKSAAINPTEPAPMMARSYSHVSMGLPSSHPAWYPTQKNKRQHGHHHGAVQKSVDSVELAEYAGEQRACDCSKT